MATVIVMLVTIAAAWLVLTSRTLLLGVLGAMAAVAWVAAFMSMDPAVFMAAMSVSGWWCIVEEG